VFRLGFPTSCLLDFYGAGEDNGGRGTDSSGGRHANRTNGAHNPPTFFYRPDALPAVQPTASKHWRHQLNYTNAINDLFHFRSYSFIRAVRNTGSWLFGRIRIIKTIIRLNTNRIWIVALNFEAMSLSFIIVNVNIVILDMHSRSASSICLWI